MEALLIKMARQLDALDEASLVNLWNQYAAQVANFEPTKRWEEATLVLSLIQAKRWKNQLFNHHWSKQTQHANLDTSIFTPDFESASETNTQEDTIKANKATVLAFKPRKRNIT